jgi:hypothetical protein
MPRTVPMMPLAAPTRAVGKSVSLNQSAFPIPGAADTDFAAQNSEQL